MSVRQRSFYVFAEVCKVFIFGKQKFASKAQLF